MTESYFRDPPPTLSLSRLCVTESTTSAVVHGLAITELTVVPKFGSVAAAADVLVQVVLVMMMALAKPY